MWSQKKIITMLAILTVGTITLLWDESQYMWEIDFLEAIGVRRSMRGEIVLVAQINPYNATKTNETNTNTTSSTPLKWGYIEPKGAARLAFQQRNKSFGIEYDLGGLASLPSMLSETFCKFTVYNAETCDFSPEEIKNLIPRYDDVELTYNPWERYGSYRPCSIYRPSGYVGMYTGLGHAENLGNIIVVEGLNAGIIGCGVLMDAADNTTVFYNTWMGRHDH